MAQSFYEYKLSLMLPLLVVSSFMLLFFYGPIDYSFNVGALFLIFLFYFSYVLGWFFYNLMPKKSIGYEIKVHTSKKREIPQILNIATVLSFFTGLYLVFVFYDFFVIGDVLNAGITETREVRTLEGPRGSIIGLLVVLFTGAPLLLLISLLAYTYSQKEKNPYIYKIQFLLSIIGLLSYFLSGGRNNFAIAMVIIFLILLILKKIRRAGLPSKKTKKYLSKGLIFGVLLVSFLFMLYIFIDRANYQGITIYSYVLRMEREFSINVTHFDFQADIVREFYYAFIVFLFYLNHPIMLVSQYFDASFSSLTYGALSFPLPTMFYDLVFGTTVFSNALDSLMLKGVYLSMPGFIFIDFGFLGVVLFGFLLGFCVPFFLKKSQTQNYNVNYYSLVLASIFLCTIILAPMYNILSSFGFSLLLMLLIIYVCIFSCTLLKRIGSCRRMS